MDPKDIIKLSPQAIRKDEDLMRQYIETYTGVFGSAPNCAGCTFKRDFNKLKKHLLTGTLNKLSAKKPSKMAAKNNVLKRAHKNEILTYRGKDNRPVRRYGYAIDDDFVDAFLSTGKKADIAARKKMFDVIDGEAQSKEAKKAQAAEAKSEKSKKAAEKKQADKLEAAKKAKEKEERQIQSKKDDNVAADLKIVKDREQKIADKKAADAGDPPAGDPPAGDPPAGDPPAGDPPAETLYDPNAVRYMNQAKLDSLLEDNLLNPKDYADLKAGKEALLALKK